MAKKHPYHNYLDYKHLLVHSIVFMNWKCNICKIDYNQNNYGYRCTKCNVNICEKCIKETNENYSNDNNIINEKGEYFQFAINNHPHPLTLLIIYQKEDFICSECNKNYQWRQPSYYCSECDYHICYSCKLKVGSYYQLSCDWHQHVLTPCKVCNYLKYKCSHCGLDIINKECYFCTLCNYYLCLNCSEKYKDNDKNKEIKNEKNKLSEFRFFNHKNSELDNHRLIRCEFKDELNKKCLNCKKKKKNYFIVHIVMFNIVKIAFFKKKYLEIKFSEEQNYMIIY